MDVSLLFLDRFGSFGPGSLYDLKKPGPPPKVLQFFEKRHNKSAHEFRIVESKSTHTPEHQTEKCTLHLDYKGFSRIFQSWGRE